MATVEHKKTDTVTLEVDGKEMSAEKGQMIIEVTDAAGIEVPRFCYHHKLTIAANCRMCLVDVEKAPKPLPACATPVADGMKVFTRSRRAVDAQRGVMEFLLINHPLDCPICDQGGECELQDLAMGYGRSVSRFTERKRVVADQNIGPLVATDMTRCIHCTRCVRFLEEIAGTAELGGVGRGEDLKISTFIERNIDSELSGNIIDLCPVGALTNKPFRFSARAWEMSARSCIGTHDCVGSNMFYHTRAGTIQRAVPRDAEAINECWLADRDRYSHFGLSADDRVRSPRIKVDGQWQDCDWDTALDKAAGHIAGVVRDSGADQLGLLTSPRATTEEHFLLRKMADALGSPHVDHRLRVCDTSDSRLGAAAMDRPMAELSAADAVFMVGSHLRHDQPILNHRVRTAWRKNAAAIMDLNPVAWKFPFDLSERMIVAPQHMAETLARLTRAAFELGGKKAPDSDIGRWIGQRDPEPTAEAVVKTLREANNGFLVLGDQALFHPHAGLIRAVAEVLADALDISLLVLPGPANSQGARLAGAVPGQEGMSAHAQLASGRKGFVLMDVEPEFDTANPAAARQALAGADSVVALAAFAGTDLLNAADVLLPTTCVPESEGSYVNADGTRQWFKSAGKSPELARPAWKILRMLGERLELDAFDFASLAEVDQMLETATTRDPGALALDPSEANVGKALWRTGPVGMYSGDALTRRSKPLQETHHADNGFAVLHPETARALGVEEGSDIRVRQAGGEVQVPLQLDASLPPESLVMPAATCLASQLGAAWGPVEVEAV